MKRTVLLQHTRNLVMALVALLIVVAGAWSSWGGAQHVLLAKGREHGTLAVTGCGEEICTGRYRADGTGPLRTDLTIERSIAAKKGDHLDVVVKPGTRELVRTGFAGGLHAWLPLGGALLLAALVVAGGLRMPRFAWGLALGGGALLVGTFFAL
ncbi:hypothetical protein ABT160_12585 [Streptomyces sp. NPDC001941]|uniref:hypothetical protein n=1 Tax=Streptomyces sp. NPDC001941 TaxID=3154659 RepID=UPI003329E645